MRLLVQKYIIQNQVFNYIKSHFLLKGAQEGQKVQVHGVQEDLHAGRQRGHPPRLAALRRVRRLRRLAPGHSGGPGGHGVPARRRLRRRGRRGPGGGGAPRQRPIKLGAGQQQRRRSGRGLRVFTSLRNALKKKTNKKVDV